MSAPHRRTPAGRRAERRTVQLAALDLAVAYSRGAPDMALAPSEVASGARFALARMALATGTGWRLQGRFVARLLRLGSAIGASTLSQWREVARTLALREK